jgi:ABC-type multidrug transport system fused ATPase/permease subunit
MRLELSSQERVSKFFHESTRFAAEAVSAIRTVASLTLEDEVIDRYAARLNGPVRRAYKRTLWLMILFGLSESVDLLGIGLAFWYGGRLMSFGEYDAEQFFLVFIAVVFGGQAAGMLFGYVFPILPIKLCLRLMKSSASPQISQRPMPLPIKSSTSGPFSQPSTSQSAATFPMHPMDVLPSSSRTSDSLTQPDLPPLCYGIAVSRFTVDKR